MSLGNAFNVVINNEDVKSGNYVFWVNPKNIKIDGSHFTPSCGIDSFWQTYLNEYYKKQDSVTRTHIYYKNNPKDTQWLSGLTIDSDIFIRISETDYIVSHTFYQDHINCECEKCIEQQKVTEKQLNKKSKEQIQSLFKKCIQEFPFEPYEVDIQFIRDLCDELFQFIQDRFNIQYDELFTKEDAGKYIILCRDNISLLKDPKVDGRGNTYYRYGFHIYFFNIKLEASGKKYIEQNFQLSDKILKTMSEFYPTTKEQEVFDRSPLIGTTSLPLSSTSDKTYSYYFEDNQLKLISENEDIQLQLDPFGGQLITLQTKFIQQSNYDMNLIQLLQKNQIFSYEEGIIFINQYLQKQFREDFQFMILLKTYQHPSYERRFQIIKSLYSFLLDEKKVQYSLLIIQCCYFMIMCEDVEQAMNQENIQISQTWMEDQVNGKNGKDKNRFPYKIVESIVEFHSSQQKLLEKGIAYKKLFDDFNQYKTKNGKEDQCIQFDAIVQISYRNFKNFVNLYQGGTLTKQFEINLATKQYQAMVFDVLFQYIYSQLESNIVVSFGKFYFFNGEEGIKDYNKYHLIQDNEIEGRVVSILNKLKDGITCQLKVLQSDFKRFKLMDEYFTLNTKDKKSFLESLEQQDADYVIQYKHYIDLFNQVCNFSQSARQKAQTTSLLIEKLSVQGQLQQMDGQDYCFGVFNGILEYDQCTKQFQLHQGKDAKRFPISKSTMFNIRQEFLDENSKLITPDKLPKDLKKIYDDLESIYKTIYKKGKDINVFHWQVYNIILRLLNKKIAGEALLISFGTGSDGKTTAKQAICCALGQGQQQLSYGNVQRKLVTGGYTAQIASTILQAKQNKPNEHGTGGYIELQNCYFALMAELSSQEPLAAESIKNMLCGTQLTSRRAYDKDVQTFQNTCFLELQTNNYPTFNTPLDPGLQRRVLFYQHDVKFVKKTIYEKLDANQIQSYALADETLRNKLNSDPDYIDVLGFYILNIFSSCNYNQSYVPDILVEQSLKFFNSSLIYMKQCVEVLQKNIGQYVIYPFYENQVRQLIQNKDVQKKRKVFELEKLCEDHIMFIKDNFMQSFVCRNNKTKEERIMSLNEFQQIQSDTNYTILIRDYCFVNEQLNDENQRLLDQL